MPGGDQFAPEETGQEEGVAQSVSVSKPNQNLPNLLAGVGP